MAQQFSGGAYTEGSGIQSLQRFLPIQQTRSPTSADNKYNIGQMWIETNANQSYILTALNSSSGGISAVWTPSFSTTSSYIVGPSGFAPYQTIQSAIDAAVSDGASSAQQANIFIWPGTYTEDLSIYDGIHLVAYTGIPGHIGFLTTPQAIPSSVTIQGNLLLDASQIASNFNYFQNISFSSSSGNTITFLTNALGIGYMYFFGCNFTISGSNNFVFAVDGYPFLLLENSVITDSGTTNSLLTFPLLNKFCTLWADTTAFLINSTTPCVLTNGSSLHIEINNSNYSTMIDSSAGTQSFDFVGNSTKISWIGSNPLFNFGSSVSRVTLNGCYVVEAGGDLVNGTSTLAGAYALITNSYYQGNVIMPNTSILNSAYISSGTSLQSFKGIGTAFSGSQEIKGQSGINTPSNTATKLVSITVNPSESIVLSGTLVASQSDHSNSVGGNFLVVANRGSVGNVSLIGSAVVNVESSSAATFTCSVDTGTQTVNLVVTGVAATSYNWVATYSYTKILNNS